MSIFKDNWVSTITNRLDGDSLKAKSARGILKLGTGAGVERLLRLVRTMILTRILAPEQFGLMAIVLVLVNVFEQISEVGIKLSVIQNKHGLDYEFLNATWWFQIARGLGLFILAMLVAPWVSSFYDKPNLLIYLQAALFAILFRGFINPKAYALQKEYKFGLVVLYMQGSALLGTIVTIICALKLRNIWALIIGYVAENFFLCVLSYIAAPFKPRIGIDRNSLKELFKFAQGMFGLGIITFIGYSAPTFVLGKVVSEEKLGLYSLALQLISIPLFFFTKIVSPVLLPGFAGKQDNKVSLYNAVLKVTELSTVLLIPLVVYMIVCSSGLLLLLWGPQYVDVTIPCVILTLLVIVRTQGSILSSTYVAVGKPYLHRRFVILMTSIIVIFIYPAIVYWGLIGAAVTSVVSSYIALFMQVIWCKRVIPLKYDEYIKRYTPGLLMSFPPVITIFLLTEAKIDSMAVILISGAVSLLIVYSIYFGRRFFRVNPGLASVNDIQSGIALCDFKK